MQMIAGFVEPSGGSIVLDGPSSEMNSPLFTERLRFSTAMVSP
ncbi:hypothetical protein LLE87_31855 [Paenibacillus polymyxa]|nr:hypothetical protein [Paenibacillus polymyxa]